MKSYLSLLLLLFVTSIYAQVEKSTYSRANDIAGGINSCEKADLDEYNYIEGHTQFNRSVPLNPRANNDYDHEIEALMFSESAGASYRFSQCQRQLYDHLEKGLQGAGEYRSLALRRAAWLQFSYLRGKINQARTAVNEANSYARVVRQGYVFGEDKTMIQMQEAMGMESQRQRYEKARAEASRLEAHLRSLVSRIPLGNRPEMKEAMIELASSQGQVSEATFNRVFENKIIELNRQSLRSVQFWEGTDGERGAGNVTLNSQGHLIARVDNDLKLNLIQSGQIEMTINARGMAERSRKEFMCRTRARYISGPQVKEGVITVASLIGGYGLARLAVRAGLRAAMAVSTAERVAARVVQVPALAAWIGIEATAMGMDFEHARQACFRPEFLAGTNEDQCSFDSEYNGVFQEASAAECITTSLLAAAPAAMSVMGVLSSIPRTIARADGAMVTTNLPNIREMIDLPNGGGRITHFDSGITLTERAGTRISEYPEGSAIRRKTEVPGEYTETAYHDGRSVRENADGSRVVVDSDGARITYDKNGREISVTGRQEIVVTARVDSPRVRQNLADGAVRGLERSGVNSNSTVDSLVRLGFRRVSDSPEGLTVFRNSKNGATITFKSSGKPRFTRVQKDEFKKVLVNREGDYVHPDAIARTRATAKDDIARDLESIRGEVGPRLDDPAIESFVRDELRVQVNLAPAQRTAAREKLIRNLRNWDGPTNIRARLLARSRQARFDRDLARFTKKYQKANPDASEASASAFARRAAEAKRARISELRGMCTSFKPNSANLKAGALFASYSGGLGAMNAGLSYAAATWDSDMSRTKWGIRLTYEIVMSYVFGRITAKITSQPDATFMQRVTRQNVVSFGANILEAGIYQSFFENYDKAKEHLDEMMDSPTFEQDVNKLIDHVNNMSHLEKFVDGMGDFANNFYRSWTGQEELKNLTMDELKALNQEALKDPIMQERLLDLIDDQMLKDNNIQTSTGNEAVDRLAFNTVYNLPSIPVNMAIGIMAFQAVCMNLDSPIKAMAAFGSITFARQFGSGYLFFASREQVIGAH